MSDEKIIEMFLRREATAVACAQKEYGKACMETARKILKDEQAAQACFNEAFLRAWQNIPPERPVSLKAYLLRLTRNLAVEKYAAGHFEAPATELGEAFKELEDCLLPPETDLESDLVLEELSEVLNGFLKLEPAQDRVCFVRRYWYGESVKEIAAACGLREERVKSLLSHSKRRLRAVLLREETYI